MKKAKRILAGALAALILTMSLPLSALADEADVPVESPSFEVSFDVDTGQEEISEDPPADIEATPEPTPEPTAEPTQEPTPTPESTATPTPTAEPTAVSTATPGVTATPTAVPTSTPESSAVPSASPVVTPTPTPTPSPQPVVNPVKLEHDVLDNVDKVCIYLFPVPNSSEITQEYSAEHKAIDIAASSGSPVYAAEDGTVSYVQIWDGSYDTTGMMSYGHMVEVRHADGNTTLYKATIDMDAKAQLSIYKYDFTNAKKDGVWNEDSYVSTGQYDAKVNEVLGGTTRTGANSASSALGNGQASNGYAIKGVEYTYLKIADITQFTESEKDGGRTDSHIEVLYAIDKVKGADMLAAIGLADGKNSYENANALDANNWYYQSDVLSAALKAALEANSTTVKNSLEAYVKNNGGTAMPETNEDGYSNVTGLPVGLYLLVETRTPEMVTGTTNPCFVSLPMTTVDGGMADGSGNQITTGGQDWNYNVVLYPKNETGIVTLEKTVREAKADTGKNNASDVITDGFKHNATASAGDTIEYQIISTLPTITSAATNISEYTFQDVLARGLSYVGGTNSVTLEFFTDANCTNKVTTWKQSDGKFKVTREENNDGTHTMTISMTDDGLAEINTANTAYDNDNGKLYAGYSNYTLRIRYDAKLNSDESLVYGDNGNKNEVVLTWKRTNDTYYDTLIDDAHIYTYATNITKTFSDGKEEQTMFDNVLFKAQNASDGYYVIAQLNEDEGIWYVTGHTDKEASATAMHPVEWNGKKGQIILKGVEDDQYIWTELETANGYTLLKNNIDVTITSVDDANRPCDIYSKDTLGVIQNDPRYNFPNNEDYKLANIPQKQLAHNYQTASATVDGNDVTMLDDEMDAGSKNAIAPLQVVNTRGFETPMTGENGTWALAIGGVLVFCLGTSAFIFFLVFKKRKEQEDK